MNPLAPGTSTSEFKLSAWIVGLINALYAAILALSANNVINIPGLWLGVLTAVVPTLTGGVAINYTRSRSAIKVAAASLTTGQPLVQVSANAGPELTPPAPVAPPVLPEPVPATQGAAPASTAVAVDIGVPTGIPTP